MAAPLAGGRQINLAPEAIITLPVRDHINRALRSALDESGMPWLPLYEMSDLPRARSYLVAQAVASGAGRVLFVDADIVATPEELRALARHPRVCSDGAVTGLYAMRDGKRWACHAPDERVEADGCRRAEFAGLGFACVSRESLLTVRSALEALHDPNFGEWHPYCVPYIDPEHGYCADDVSLWRRLALAGTQLWADTHLVVGHVATFTLRSLV